MYVKIESYSSLSALFQEAVARIIHQGRWRFVDGLLADEVVTSWPSALTSPTAETGDWVVLRAPRALGTPCLDVIRIANLAEGPEITIFRSGDGTVDAWDLAEHTAAGDANAGEVASTPPASGVDAHVFCNDSGLLIVCYDSVEEVGEGVAAGYLDPLASTGDPYPLCVFEVKTPVSGTFGDGFAFDEANQVEATSIAHRHRDVEGNSVLSASPWGGGTPWHVCEALPVLQGLSGTPYLRGYANWMRLTSVTIPSMSLLDGATAFVTVAPQVAVGPL